MPAGRRSSTRARAAALAALVLVLGGAAVVLSGMLDPGRSPSPTIAPASRRPLARIPVATSAPAATGGLPGLAPGGLVLGAPLSTASVLKALAPPTSAAASPGSFDLVVVGSAPTPPG